MNFVVHFLYQGVKCVNKKLDYFYFGLYHPNVVPFYYRWEAAAVKTPEILNVIHRRKRHLLSILETLLCLLKLLQILYCLNKYYPPSYLLCLLSLFRRRCKIKLKSFLCEILVTQSLLILRRCKTTLCLFQWKPEVVTVVSLEPSNRFQGIDSASQCSLAGQ